MKKLLLFTVIAVAILATLLSGALHIGSPCDRAQNFANHVGPNGSNHFPEFNGPQGMYDILRGVHNGQIPFSVYGSLGKTVLVVPNTQYGIAVLIWGSGGNPTMYVLRQGLSDLVRGLHYRDSVEDISSAKNTAGCFADSLVTAGVAVGVVSSQPGQSSSSSLVPAVPNPNPGSQLLVYTMFGVVGFSLIMLLVFGALRRSNT
jgi:hypothetical protein